MGNSPWAVIISAMDTKLCTKCAKELPSTLEFFRPRHGEISSVCITCHRTQKKAEKKRAKGRRANNLSKLEAAGVDLYVQATQTGGSNIPHSAEVIERVFQYFGGVGGFSSIIVKQYYDSPPGGTARNRLIETIVRLVAKNVEQGGAKKPLTLWSEDELEKELESRFNDALSTYKGITINGQATPLIAAPADPADAASIEKALLDAVSKGRDQEFAVGDTGTEDRGVEALRANGDAVTDS